MLKWFLSTVTLAILISCSSDHKPTNRYPFSNISSDSSNIVQRFAPLEGYQRIASDEGGFADWLRHLPLKPSNSTLYFYTGDEALTKDGHEAIVDIPVRNNTQNSTAILLRLWAEYHFQAESFNQITFRLKNGKDLPYYKWQKGYRAAVQNDKVVWQDMNVPDTTHKGFQQYLNLALANVNWNFYLEQLEKIPASEVSIGDIVYQKSGGSHAMMVADMATDGNGNKAVIFIEGGTPPVDVHVTSNKRNPAISPWYLLSDGEPLITPFWAFSEDNYYRFPGGVMDVKQ